MAQQTPVDLNQTEPNTLSAVADQERAKLIPKNDYNKVGNEYSSVNKDAMADGDSLGRGTGTFLDVYNTAAGTIEDVVERKNKRVDQGRADDVGIGDGEAPVVVNDGSEEAGHIAGGFLELVGIAENSAAELVLGGEAMVEFADVLVVVILLLTGEGEERAAGVREGDEGLEKLLRGLIEAAGGDDVAGEGAAEGIG